MVIEREFELKKKLVDLKNELVSLRVTYDMGEYQNLVQGQKTQRANLSKKQVENSELPSYEKVK